MLLALEDPTTAIVAHGLLNSMAAVSGTATTLLQHWELFTEDPDLARELLGRIVRQADMASGVLEDLVRGLPPDVAATLAAIER
jgi:signal transduction histidine kinase